MISLLFGELKRLSVLRRLELVVGAVGIAVVANFIRAVFLVMVAATENFSEVTRWHDVAGYTILALVFFGTLGLAYLLGNSEIRTQTSDVRNDKSQSAIVNRPVTDAKQRPGFPSAIASSWLIAAICWLLFVEIGTATWYRVHETNLVSGIRWSVRWPEQAPNFRKLKIDEEIRSVLRFDEGETAAWTITPTAETAHRAVATATPVDPSSPNTIACYLYVFRWKPGRNSALLANLHRPDVCLPASGWTKVADNGVRNYAVSDSFQLPFRHFEFQRAFEDLAPQTAHAFYSLSEDRAS